MVMSGGDRATDPGSCDNWIQALSTQRLFVKFSLVFPDARPHFGI